MLLRSAVLTPLLILVACENKPDSPSMDENTTTGDTQNSSDSTDTSSSTADTSDTSASTTNSSSTESDSNTETTSDDSTPPFELTPQNVGTDARLIGLDVFGNDTIWAAGTAATYVVSKNGGQTWTSGQIAAAAADELQIRDVEIVGPDDVYMLTIGPAEESRIYRSTDGGTNWIEQFRGEAEATTFFDCIDFWNKDRGIAYSDSVDGQLFVISTADGATWNRIDPAKLPPAAGAEAAFASSGTCVVAHGTSSVWIGTGGGDTARILMSNDYGESWTAQTPPIIGGSPSSGITSLVVINDTKAFAFGGDLEITDTHTNNIVATQDGGQTWTAMPSPELVGAIYGAAASPDGNTLMIAGPAGMDVSLDGGMSWQALSRDEHWSVVIAENGIGWAAGPNGRLTRIERK